MRTKVQYGVNTYYVDEQGNITDSRGMTPNNLSFVDKQVISNKANEARNQSSTSGSGTGGGTGQGQTNTDSFNIPSDASKSQDHNKYTAAYYTTYSDLMTKAGLTPLSKSEWANKYLWSQGTDPSYKDADEKYSKEISDSMIETYNKNAAELAKTTGQPPEFYNPEWNTKDPNEVYKKLSTLNANLSYYKENKKEEAPAYNFDINETLEDGTKRWQEILTMQDEANKAIKAEAPTLNTDLVTEWENKIDPIYQRQKERTTKSARDVWGSLFGQEGGSTYEAGKLTEALKGIDIEKLNKAIAFAEVEQGQKYNTWANQRADALNKLSSIASFKAAQDQFGSSMDASNFWNNLQATTQKQQYYDSQAYNSNQTALQQQYAKEMAQMIADANKTDPWMDLAKSAISGGITGLTYGLSAPKTK